MDKTSKTLMSLEFPGVVNNLDRMMDMIGGHDKLETVFNEPGSRLQLRFRPEDVYAHAVHGECIPVQQVLVRFKRKRLTYNDGSTEEVTTSEVIGVIESSFIFQSLCDLQYLPMKRVDGGNTSKNPKYISIKENIIPSDPYNPENLDDKDFNPTAPLFILPTIFCRFDSPITDYNYRNGPEIKDKDLKDMIEQQREKAVIGKIRKSRSLQAHVVSFKSGQEVPTEASPDIITASEAGLANKELLPKMKEAFEERPVWTRHGLMFHLKCSLNELRYTLAMIAFNVIDGPWRNTWIVFGYDPRKNKDSVQYQTIDFRVRRTYNNKKIDELLLSNKRRTIMQYQIPLQKTIGSRDKTPAVIASVMPSTSKRDEEQESRKDSQMQKLQRQVFFKPGIIPSNRQLVYQLMDIDLSEVKEMITKKSRKDAPDDKDGWLPTGSVDRIRSEMKKTLDKTVLLMAQEKGWIEGKASSFFEGLTDEEDTSGLATEMLECSVEGNEDDDDEEEDSDEDWHP